MAARVERHAIRLAGDLVDTEVTKGPSQSDRSPAGAELIYAPNKSMSLAADYTIPLNEGWSLVLHADRARVAEQYANTQNTLVVPAYNRTNARVTLRSADDKWRIAAYANNLSNDAIMRSRNSIGILHWHAPRQVGLEVGYQ